MVTRGKNIPPKQYALAILSEINSSELLSKSVPVLPYHKILESDNATVRAVVPATLYKDVLLG